MNKPRRPAPVVNHNRESWLTGAADMLHKHYRSIGFATRRVQAACGWAATTPWCVEGEVWLPDCSPVGTRHVFISPEIGDSHLALAVLAHEVAHTIDMAVGHRGVFVRAVSAIGLVRPWSYTNPGPRFDEVAPGILDVMGQYPHRGLYPEWQRSPKRFAVLFRCRGCGYEVRVGQRHAARATPVCGDVRCPRNLQAMEVKT